MRKKTIVILSSIAILAMIGATSAHVFFSPTPIIKDVDTSRIVSIQYNKDGNGVMVGVEEYNETAILRYLGTCMERKMTETAGTYLLGNVTLRIILNTEDGLKEILLGKINYSSYGYGTQQYEILNAGEVRVALLEFLNLAP